jgi:hypothetical protein
MAYSLFSCTSLVLYTFHPYSKIPQLNTTQARASETSRDLAALKHTPIAFHDPKRRKNHGVFFGVHIPVYLLRFRVI